VSRYQKGQTNLDFTEARDSEWQRHQLGHMQVCTSLQTDNHASTLPLSSLQAGCPSCRPTNDVKAPTIYHCIAQIHKNTTMLFSIYMYILTEQTASKHPARKLSVDVTPAILVTFSCSDLSRTRVCLTFKLKLDNRLFITFADLSSRVVSASDCGLREPRFESRR